MKQIETESKTFRIPLPILELLGKTSTGLAISQNKLVVLAIYMVLGGSDEEQLKPIAMRYSKEIERMLDYIQKKEVDYGK